MVTEGGGLKIEPAASALQHRLTLVTRIVADFAGLGVTLLNPFIRNLPHNH